MTESRQLAITLYRELMRSCRRITQLSRCCPDHTPIVLEVARRFGEEQQERKGLRLTMRATRWDVSLRP